MKSAKLLLLFIFTFLIVLSSAQNVSAELDLTSLNNAVVSYWNFDETSGTSGADSKGSNTGTASNSRVFTSNTGTSGIINSGADFTQGNDDIEISQPTGTEGTFNVWLKANSLSSINRIFSLSQTNDATNNFQFTMLTNGRFRIADTTARNVETQNTFDVDTWYMVTFMSDGSEYKIFVNGVEQTLNVDGSNTGNWFDDFNNINKVWFGRWQRSISQGYFDGFIDEASIFNRPLTQDEIEFLYASGSPSSNQQYEFVDFVPVVTTTAEFNFEEAFTTTTGIRGQGVLNESVADSRVNYQIIRERSGSNTTLVDSFTTSFTNGGLNWETSQTIASSSTQQGDKLYVVAQVVDSTDPDILLSNEVTSDPLDIVNRDPVINSIDVNRGTVAVTSQDISWSVNVNDLDLDALDVSWELRKGSTVDFEAGTLVDSDTIVDITKNSNVFVVEELSSSTSVGDFYRLDITVTDDFGGEVSSSSVVTEVISSLSDVDRIVFNPSPLFTPDNLIATAVLTSENNEDIRVYYEVTINSEPFSSGTLSSYYEENNEFFFELPAITSINFVQGDEISVFAEPRNIEGDVIGGSDTDSIIVSNRAPTIVSTAFDPEVLINTNSFDIRASANDLDFDSLNLSWRVERTRDASTTEILNGTFTGYVNFNSLVTLATVSSSLIEADDQIRFFVTASDGIDSSAEAQSSLLTVTEITDTLISASDIYSGESIIDYSLLVNSVTVLDSGFETDLDGWSDNVVVGDSQLTRSTEWSSEGDWSMVSNAVNTRPTKTIDFTDVAAVIIDINSVSSHANTFNKIIIGDEGSEVRSVDWVQGIQTITVNTLDITGNQTLQLGGTCIGFGTSPCSFNYEVYFDNIRLVAADNIFQSDGDGLIILEEADLSNGIYNFSYVANGYFERTYNDVNYEYPYLFDAELTQATAEFTATEIVTEETITDFVYVIEGVSYNSTQTIPISAGTYEVTFVKEDYYNLTSNFTVNPLTNNVFNFNNVFDAILNITATDNVSGITYNTFNITYTLDNYTSQAYSTNNGFLELPIKNNNEIYNIQISDEAISPQNRNVLINSTYQEFEFSVLGVRSILFRFYDQENPNVLLENINITLELISDEASYINSTTTGEIYLLLLEPATYQARYNADTYSERFTVFTVTEDTGDILDLYLIKDEDSTPVTINIVDQLVNAVEGATVRATKYNPSTNTYIVQNSRITNSDGVVIMPLTFNDEFYKFIIELNGRVLRTTNPSYITSDDITIQVDTRPPRADIIRSIRNVQYNLIFNDETNNFRFEWSDITGFSNEVCMDIYQVLNSRNMLLDSVCSQGSAGTLLYNVNNESGVTYKAEVFLKTEVDEQRVFLDSLFKAFRLIRLNEPLTVLMSILIILSVVGATYVSIRLMMVTLPLSILFLYQIGFLNISGWYVIAPLFVLGILTMILIRGRN